MSKLGNLLNKHKNLILITIVVVGLGIGPALELLAFYRCKVGNNEDLYKAIRGEDVARVAKLLSRGANPNSCKRCFFSSDGNQESGVTQVLERTTPLMTAIGGDPRDREMVVLLLDAGADPNFPSEYNGLTPLLFALEQRHEKMVPILLAHGADPNRPDDQNRTPFMIADEMDEPDSRKALLAAGADPRPREVKPLPPASFGSSSNDD
ncbi:MAG: ankyrin repeat domain-containing protein [Terracidiphilus sp.]|jgi:ankyrin repeat protein